MARLDIFDVEGVTRAVQRLDVLVSSYQPGNAANDAGDAIRRSIADPGAYARAAKVLMKALEGRTATRLIVVGGAASLEIAAGRTTDDDDDRLRDALRGLGVPEGYAVAVRGHRAALDALRLSNMRWTYASPSADIHAGERTGRFRVGGDQLLVEPPAGARSPTRTSPSRSSTRSSGRGTSSAASPSATEPSARLTVELS